MLCSESHELLNSIWNKEEMPQQWKESITAPNYKNGVKTEYSNYRGISMLPITHEILINILISWLNPHTEKITVNHQCGF